MSESIVIVSAARTPIGGMLGDFSSVPAWELGATAIAAAVKRAGLAGDAVDEVLMGNCLMAGQGQAPARQAALEGRAAAVGRRGHLVQDVRLGHARDDVRARHARRGQRRCGRCRRHGKHDQRAAPDAIARKGVRYGAAQLFDHMAIDGLEDAYERGKAMGVFAENCVAQVPVQPRGAGPVRDPLHAARARRPTKTAASTGRSRR